MATLALTIVGNILLPGVGGAIGAALGGIIDNQFIFPELFGTDTPVQKGPRLESLQFQSAAEGSPIKRIYGPETRLAGTVLWKSEVREVVNEEGGEGEGGCGGGGGGGGTTYSYFVDVAVAIGMGPIVGIVRFKGDERIVYQSLYTFDLTSTQIGIHNSNVQTCALIMPPGRLELGTLRLGQDVVVTGFANAANNGTWEVRTSYSYPDAPYGLGSEAYLHRRGQPGAFVDEAYGESVNLISDIPLTISRADGVTVYLGSETQTADPTIEAFETDVPAFRGIAYVVIENLHLGDFGNRIPNFQFWVEADSVPHTVGDAIESILARSGRASAEYDASACTESLRGYIVAGPQPVIQQIEPLLFAFDLATFEVGGVLSFVPRASLETGTIDPDDLGAAPDGDDPSEPNLRLDEPGDQTLVQEVTVEHADPGQNLQAGLQRERIIDGLADVVENIRLPMTLAAGEAREIAQRTLWRTRAERTAARLSLPPSYAWVKENDVLDLAWNGEAYELQVVEAATGANGVIDLSTLVRRATTLDVTLDVDEVGGDFQQPVYVPPDVTLYLMNLAALTSEDEDVRYIFYFAAAATDPAAIWQGAALYRSFGGTDYNLLLNMPPEATLGVTTDALDDAPVVGMWDEVSTVTVQLFHGELVSATREQVLNGSNLALVADELIAFRTATLIAENTYTLSGLLRGLRDTDSETTGHATDDRFVLMGSTSRGAVAISWLTVASGQFFKAVPAFGDLADATPIAFEPSARCWKPFAPMYVRGSRDFATDDLTFTWFRRTRRLTRFLGPDPVDPSWRVDYELRTAAGDVLRVSASLLSGDADDFDFPSITWTSAQQTTAGHTPGTAIKVVVRENINGIQSAPIEVTI